MNTNEFNKQMKKSGYSNESLAKALGISRSSLFRKKKGVTEFTYTELERCCDLLHIDNEFRKTVFFN